MMTLSSKVMQVVDIVPCYDTAGIFVCVNAAVCSFLIGVHREIDLMPDFHARLLHALRCWIRPLCISYVIACATEISDEIPSKVINKINSRLDPTRRVA